MSSIKYKWIQIDLLHEAQKSTLADAIWKLNDEKDAKITENVQYVLDGGALLHRIPWIRGTSFSKILQSYSDYVKSHYGDAVIVFDGYDESSTKDMTHMKRSKGKKGVSVTFTANMNITVSKEDFLTNNLNKKQFVSLLSRQLESTGSKVFMAKADADLLIVNKAIEAAETRNTVLVGDDTDLLVLLLHHLLPIENKKECKGPCLGH